METGEIRCGFRVTRVRKLDELQGKLWEMEHEKTGAKLCWLDRSDENGAFCITFKTLPEDSAGVFHILEHSVLGGSEKYPVKEPFVELLKTSMQTFLNAMTYADKTVFPASSRNKKDLLNLMDVYLDGVFHPLIYRSPEIFLQEGWHLEEEDGELFLQGVVLNEMKGAFSDPGMVLEREMKTLLFPDNCYRFASGGDPAHIPELRYEDFLAAHRKYYHPSNAWITLSGSIDINAVLEKLDGFFTEFERREEDFPIFMQEPAEARTKETFFEIGPGEETMQRTILSGGMLLGCFEDRLRTCMTAVLCDYLAGDEDAPLKRAVMDRRLAQDFVISIHDGMQQNWLSWEAWNTEEEAQEEIIGTIQSVATELTQNGLDRDRLEACFSRYAFAMRDRDSADLPRSLNETLEMLDTWLYGGDPAEGLVVEELLEKLKDELRTDAPERLLGELFLKRTDGGTVVLKPSVTLGEEQAGQEAERLREISKNWIAADWEQVRETAQKLQGWQQTPDTEEALASIPVLELTDLKNSPAPVSVTEDQWEGLTVLQHQMDPGLIYFRAWFWTSDCSQEELPLLMLMGHLLGILDTKAHSRDRLQLEIRRTTGRLAFWPTVMEGSDADHCRVLFGASLVCLPEQVEQGAALMREILTETVWEDVDLLREVLRQLFLGMQASLNSAGDQYALSRIKARLNARGTANEYMSGTEALIRIKSLAKASDGELGQLLCTLKEMAERIFTRNRLTLSCSETAPEKMLQAFCSGLPEGEPSEKTEACYPLLRSGNEGLLIPSAVGYAAMGTDLSRHGREYTGSIPVLAGILNYTYLWNEIRVQGGAYGCGFRGHPNGDLSFTTYRDPQPGRSLEVMRRAAGAVRDFCEEPVDLTGFIISAVSELDPLRTPGEVMSTAEWRWFTGMSEGMVCQWYRELLHTTPEDLKRLIPMLEEMARDDVTCMAGNAEILGDYADQSQRIMIA